MLGAIRKNRVLPLWLLALLALTLPATGCTGAFTGLVYVLKGRTHPAEWTGLKGKKVVVVCRKARNLQHREMQTPQEIATQVAKCISAHVNRVDIIDPAKVAEWVDGNSWKDFTEIGRALEADIVVGIDLNGFSLQQSHTLFQGRVNYTVEVWDVAKRKAVFEKEPQDINYPPNSGVAAQDTTEAAFRAQFIRVIANKVTNLFYDHEYDDDIATDALAFQRSAGLVR